MKFRKKPIIVEAMQFKDELEFVAALSDFIGDNPWQIQYSPEDGLRLLRIMTPEGESGGKPGCWIVKGVRGEFYPVREDIFLETYEPVED